MSATADADEEFDPRLLRTTDFRVLRTVPTRWSDEDSLGHVNNAVHYQVFDTAVNSWLIEVAGDVRAMAALGVVADSSCRYLGELHFPEVITIGLALERLGERSVRYRLAMFGEQLESPAAFGRFVHVYVDRATRRPVPVPAAIRDAVSKLGALAGPASGAPQ